MSSQALSSKQSRASSIVCFPYLSIIIPLIRTFVIRNVSLLSAVQISLGIFSNPCQRQPRPCMINLVSPSQNGMVTEQEAGMEGFQKPSAPGFFSRFPQQQQQPSSVQWPCLPGVVYTVGRARYVRTYFSREVASIPLRLAGSFAGAQAPKLGLCVCSRTCRDFSRRRTRSRNKAAQEQQLDTVQEYQITTTDRPGGCAAGTAHHHQFTTHLRDTQPDACMLGTKLAGWPRHIH